jgi:SAM-dependent methyltransferase
VNTIFEAFDSGRITDLEAAMKVCLFCANRFESNGWCCPGCGQSPNEHNGHLSFSLSGREARDSFSAPYYTQLANLEAGHFWFRSRNRLLIWVLRRFFSSAKSFLEIGCGTGVVLSEIQREFPELVLSGSDVLTEGLVFAEKRLSGVPLFQMDAHFIPFDDEFDVIGAFDVLEHIQEDEDVLLQMFKAVKKGGGMIVSVPQHPFLWSYVDEYSFHKRRYRRKELIQKVEKAGFRYLWNTSFVSLLLPLMFLVRMGKLRQGKERDPFRELKIGVSLNNALLKMMNAENCLIRAGISFPLGGSLLLVAKKF